MPGIKNTLKFTFLFITFVFYSLSATLHAGPQQRAAIATAHPIATRAGESILKQGGNAFDAAVAISATLAVVEPFSSGIGGGGFWLLQDGKSQKTIMIDGREKAPLAAHEKLYQDEDNGNVIDGLSIDGALAAGIPGEPAALVHIAKKYGRLSLEKTLAPAIAVARKGFKVTEMYQRMAGFRLKALLSSTAAAKIFLLNNKVPHLGHLIKQVDLAKTLEAIARDGNDGFYSGDIAKALVKGNRASGGIWTLDDLEKYKIKERKPIIGHYKNYKIISAAPPSSGGIALVTMLNILENYPIAGMQPEHRIHTIVEAMRRAYRDRAEFLGDPDFVSIPTAKLINKSYAKTVMKNFSPEHATPSSALKPASPIPQGQHTTHFSIVDKDGNKVSATLSINYPFGSGFVPAGTGVLLNDEMDDFSAKPGVSNVYGLVGNENNAIEGGKRMLSSMSPTIVHNRLSNDYAIIGTPGGSRIITMVLHGILGFVEGKTADNITNQPRYHHQYLPDSIQIEPNTINEEVQAELVLKGHQLKNLTNRYGNMQIITNKNNKLTAASDPRGEGSAIVIK